MSSQGRRLRRRPKYTHSDSGTIAVLIALGREHHCTVIEGKEIYIKYQGRFMRLGKISDIKSMTVRGLIGCYEELTQDWRYEVDE